MKTFVSIVAVAAAASIAAADITTIDQNLGTIGFGSHSITGTTVGASNDVDTYSNSNFQARWNSDRVIQFTTLVPFTISMTSNDPDSNPDNDFFLLNSLTTTVNGSGLSQATTVHGNQVLISGSFGVQPAGTYYLVIDSWFGVPGQPGTAERQGAFAVTLNLVPTPGTAALIGLGGLAAARRRRA